ncbi:phage portal protein [Paremcibacter congregatus]|uniref:phage portal protein n=1 Tax=Paremcibacter congregatus TaxID=2043170 RepID=UPI0030EBAF04|tara:strand:- start:9424 stop:10677 length:1254 start_codon:yes stop_codon:yes gene_type:complete
MAFLGWFKKNDAPVRAALPDGGVTITTPAELADYLGGRGSSTASGAVVNEKTAMQVAAVYRSVAIISGAIANMPLMIKRRVNDRERQDASNHYLWKLLRKTPNGWMTGSGFRRLMTLHVLLRGNGYALIVRSRGAIIQLIPMHPDRVEVTQMDDMSLVYKYTRKDGRVILLKQSEVLHLSLMSFDGVTGITPIQYAREAIGLSLQTEKHGAGVFKNGASVAGVFKHPGGLKDEAIARLKEDLEQYKGSENSHKTMILEDGMDYAQIAMTQEDAQFIETRKLSIVDIAMFFGVPPHMLGNTEKSTSWGTGIEQQKEGFVAFTLQDYLTMWQDTIARDLIEDADVDIYAKFKTSSLVQGDFKTRWDGHTKAVQFGIVTVNEVRALEDMNPIEGGDVRYPPPNTNGTEGVSNEPEKPTEN